MSAAVQRRLLWLAAAIGALLVALVAVTTWGGEDGASEALTVTPAVATPEVGLSASHLTGSGFALGFGDALSLVWRLGLVAAVLAGAVFALRWWGRRIAAPSSQSGLLRVLDTLSIGGGRTLHLLEAGGRVYLVGATTQHISLIGELEREHVAQLLEALHQARSSPPFSGVLRAAMGGGTRPVPDSHGVGR